MPDISADYAGIADASGKLSTQCNTIIPEIYGLMSRVETLLDGGLYLEQASPALKTAYEEFSKGLQMTAAQLQGWAQILTGISDGFKNNDMALFAGAISGIDGDEGYEWEPDPVETDTDDPPEWSGQSMGGTPVHYSADGETYLGPTTPPTNPY